MSDTAGCCNYSEDQDYINLNLNKETRTNELCSKCNSVLKVAIIYIYPKRFPLLCIKRVNSLLQVNDWRNWLAAIWAFRDELSNASDDIMTTCEGDFLLDQVFQCLDPGLKCFKLFVFALDLSLYVMQLAYKDIRYREKRNATLNQYIYVCISSVDSQNISVSWFLDYFNLTWTQTHHNLKYFPFSTALFPPQRFHESRSSMKIVTTVGEV